MADARVNITVRRPVAGGYRFDSAVAAFDLTTAHVPVVGDLVYAAGGTCVVVGRFWMFPTKGSSDEREGRGPLVELIVERSVGPFHDEVVGDDEEDQQ